MKKKKVRLHVQMLDEYNRGYSTRIQGKRRLDRCSPHWARGWHAADAEIRISQRRQRQREGV